LKLFNIKKDERRQVLILFVQFFAVVATSITGGSARDAFFLNLFDRSYLPLMFVAIAITMVIVINVYKRVTDGKDIIQIITTGGVIFAVILLTIQISLTRLFSMYSAGESITHLPEKWLIPVLFVFMEIVVSLSILQFWMLAGEIFDARQAKRLFSILGAGGSVAGMLAGYSLKPFVKTFGSDKLLYLTIFFIVLYVSMGILINRYRETDQDPKQIKKSKEEPKKGKTKFKFDPYLKSIALLIGLAAFISKIIDYQFKMTAVQTFPAQDDLVSFFGTYYMATGAATIIMQFFITGVVLARFGILAGLLFLPISLALGSSGFLMIPILISVFMAKFSDQVFKFSINNASQEILWLPVPKDRKKQAKPVIDSAIRASLEGVVGILIFVLVQFKIVPTDKLNLLSIIALVGIIAWVWNSFRLKNGYVKTLMKAIEKRQLNLEDVEFDVTDNHIVQTIEKTLTDEDEFKQLFGIDLIKTMPLDPWKDTLTNLFRNGTANVKKAVLELAKDKPNILLDQDIIESAKLSEDIKPESIAVAGDRNLSTLSGDFMENLDHDNLEIRSASACSLMKMNLHIEEAKTVLQLLLISSDVHEIKTALQFLDKPMGILDDKKLEDFLQHESPDIREESLKIAEIRQNPELLDHIIGNLAHPKTAIQARQALSGFDDELVLNNLDNQLYSQNNTFPMRIGIIRCLKHYGVSKSADILHKGLSEPYLNTLSEVTNSLLSVSRKEPPSDEFIKEIGLDLDIIAKKVFQLELFLHCLPDDENCFLLRDHINSDIKKIIPIMLKLGVLHDPKTPIETYIQYVSSEDPELMPYVLELVDSTFSPGNRKMTMPLIDNDMDTVKTGKELFNDILVNFDDLVLSWIHGDHKWKEAIALNYIIKSNRQDLLEMINWDKVQDTIFIDQLFNRIEDETGQIKQIIPLENYHLSKETDMYSILEKTILLKSVELFKNIPGDVLTRIAQIAEEIHHSDESLMFSEGDYGDSMYVVVDGNVKIHKGEHHIVTLGKSTVLGEMALLDQEPRSADATAEAETTLLKIAQDGFYELMAGNAEIMQEIIKLLSGRLRETNIKLQEAQAN
jgi:AAA family ATP:ADP antiporter